MSGRLRQEASRLWQLRHRVFRKEAGRHDRDPDRGLGPVDRRRLVVLTRFHGDRDQAVIAQEVEECPVDLLLQPEDHRNRESRREGSLG